MDPAADNLKVVHLGENVNITETQAHLEAIKDKVIKEGKSWRSLSAPSSSASSSSSSCFSASSSSSSSASSSSPSASLVHLSAQPLHTVPAVSSDKGKLSRLDLTSRSFKHINSIYFPTTVTTSPDGKQLFNGSQKQPIGGDTERRSCSRPSSLWPWSQKKHTLARCRRSGSPAEDRTSLEELDAAVLAGRAAVYENWPDQFNIPNFHTGGTRNMLSSSLAWALSFLCA